MKVAPVIVGKRKVALRDVVNVAVLNAETRIDKAALEALVARAANNNSNRSKKKNSNEDENKENSRDTSFNKEQVYTVEQSRAVTLVKVVNLLQGKGPVVRCNVPERLVDLLNQDAIPCLSQEKPLLHLTTLMEPVVVLTPSEKSAMVGMQQDTCAANALACLAVEQASALLDAADGIAGLTCDAFGAHTEPFSTEHHDQSRPHAGNKEVASRLRAVVRDSGCAGQQQKKRKQCDPFCIAGIPQIHGPARMLGNVWYRSMGVELNAFEQGSGRFGGANDPAPHAPQPMASLSSKMMDSLTLLCNASAERTLCMLQQEEQQQMPEDADLLVQALTDARQEMWNQMALVSRASTSVMSQSSSIALDAAKGMLKGCELLRKVLGMEVAVSMHIVEVMDKTALEQSRKAIEKKLEAMKKREEAAAKKAAAAAAAAAEGSNAADVQQQQRKPKKNNKKEKKAVNLTPKGVVLGLGTRKMRDYFSGAYVEASLLESSRNVAGLLDATCPELAELWSTIFAADAGSGFRPKVAKGARDFGPEQMVIREKAFGAIVDVFRKHGAVALDTPVFELKETLTGKYGEDSKLIYDLADQGGEQLALRYDLTVPFARYLATNATTNIKRYHIARVYRRDQPAMNRGRFREFYQCDFDIAGEYASMVPDAEVLTVLTEILDGLHVGQYRVKLSHRKLLDAVMDVCGVPASKFRTICSAVDKLDKDPWEKVRLEMTVEKGLDEAVADRLGEYVANHGQPFEMLAKLREDSRLSQHALAKEAFAELQLLFEYIDALGQLSNISFDLSLARGLDYYTGVIYEAVLEDNEIGVGSIAAGGRYDNLVGMFSGKQVPAVGVSIGIERVFAIIAHQMEKQQEKIRRNTTQVMVCSTGKNLLPERMRICKELWSGGLRAEFDYKLNPKIGKQLSFAEQSGIPYAVVIGEEEVQRGVVAVKVLATEEQKEVQRSELVAYLQNLVSSVNGGEQAPQAAVF